ncbi:hypothetical protein [Acetobacterium bakii]|uniref:Uncharacterized protein n=1 Tax=Acetobacterium bakii TaxID=52689 RepID=A0A0L6TY10_9FIRM|nr:hypothetical protein [Acetobacterium bakii]KNZ40445.1 hypothetical protein AKG39_17675 [Acetobacterium bakii]
MTKYCPRCTYILGLDDTICRFCGMVLTTKIVVDEFIADEFPKEEKTANGSFATQFMDNGMGVTSGAEASTLVADDEILAEEIVLDEIIGDKIFSNAFLAEEKTVNSGFATEFLDHGMGVTPGSEKKGLEVDDELSAEEMVLDEIIGDGVLAQKNRSSSHA